MEAAASPSTALSRRVSEQLGADESTRAAVGEVYRSLRCSDRNEVAFDVVGQIVDELLERRG